MSSMTLPYKMRLLSSSTSFWVGDDELVVRVLRWPSYGFFDVR